MTRRRPETDGCAIVIAAFIIVATTWFALAAIAALAIRIFEAIAS